MLEKLNSPRQIRDNREALSAGDWSAKRLEERGRWRTAVPPPAIDLQLNSDCRWFYCPVALSFTSCGLYPPEYVIVVTPVTGPVVVGVAFTRNVHCAPAARELLHGVPPPVTAEKSPLAA
jgi:hypothetical protein